MALLLPGSPAVASPALTSENARSPAFDTRAAWDVLRRVVPDQLDQIDLVPVRGKEDFFRVTGSAGHIRVQGTSPAVLLTGFHWYLRHVAKTDINWTGESGVPATLPAVPGQLVHNADVPHRFALNDTNDGYTGPYWDWSRWQREIDRLAMQGYNEVLVYTGQEAVYQRTLADFGYSRQQARSWFPSPGHQPWWLLQNMCCFSGPQSQRMIDQRAELGRRIADRLRELGMTPVLPGYYGTVPAGFADRNPGAHVVPQGEWAGLRRPGWLDPRNKYYPRMAGSFYRHSAELFGKSTMYKMDLLHEGGHAGDVPVAAATRSVQAALQRARPGAIWALLGWQDNPPEELVRAVRKDRTLILDGLSDRYAHLNRERDWRGTPYTFGTIWNFGGHTTIGANLGVWNDKYFRWRDRPDSVLTGTALMPEAGDNNPVALDFFSELAWRDSPVDLRRWFGDWAASRYGGQDPHARAAWDILRRTAYAMPDDGWSEAHDNLFSAQPSLTATNAAQYSPQAPRYDLAALEPALTELLRVGPELRHSTAYRYDLVDVARQVLANRSRVLLPRIKNAFDAGDQARLHRLTDRWLRDMGLLEGITGTDEHFLLGRWLREAKSAAEGPAERAKAEYDARSLLTSWGPRETAKSLHEYANREWNGLIGGLYRKRWELYFTELSAALAEHRAPRPIDWFAVDEAWNRKRDSYPASPVGNAYQVATKIAHALDLPDAQDLRPIP